MWQNISQFFRRKIRKESQTLASADVSSPADTAPLVPNLKIADLPEGSDVYLRDTKWPPDPRFNESFTVRQVFNQQGGLIRRICSAMPLSDEDLEKYFLPAVWNVANFVHLLSASKDTHHRGYGGLFAHSLETALYSVNISKNKIFDFSEAPEVAFHNRGRWILACALAGLVHDVGKAVTDITVRTKQGEVWNPNEAPLGTWLERHGRPEFSFSWNNDREYSRHPLASLDYARKLVPEETYRYLTSAANRNIENELRAAILGGEDAKNGSLIAQIVRQADSLSVRLDNEASGNVDKRDKLVTSEPTDRVMQAICELIAEKKWTVNDEAGAVFVTKRGTFVRWTNIRDILSKLRSQGYAGAPESRDILASLLMDRGLLERPPEEIDTTRRLYWPVCPLEKRDEFLPCVKVAVPERLFIGPMPAETEALVRKLPMTDDEVAAWQNRWGFVPAEEEAKEEMDAYMSSLLSEADKESYEEPEDPLPYGIEDGYADLFPDDLDYNGLWGAEAPADSDGNEVSEKNDFPSPASDVSMSTHGQNETNGDAAEDEREEDGGEQKERTVSPALLREVQTSTMLPPEDQLISDEEAALLGLGAEPCGGAGDSETKGSDGGDDGNDASDSLRMEDTDLPEAEAVSDPVEVPAVVAAATVASTATVPASEETAAGDEERIAMKEPAAGQEGLEEPAPASGTASFVANRIDSERTDQVRGRKRRRVTVIDAKDETAVRNQSEKVRGTNRAAKGSPDSPDSPISEEEALAILGGTSQAVKSEVAVAVAPVCSQSEGAKPGEPIVGDGGDVENAADKTAKTAEPSSPVRSDVSEKRETSNPGKTERKKTERKTAQKRSKSSKSGRTSPVQEVREMIDDLKRQIVDRKGPYVELGVSQRSDGTLTANTLAFERELEAKGLDRMLVTRELSGFQVQPILSVDWSRSLFALAVSP